MPTHRFLRQCLLTLAASSGFFLIILGWMVFAAIRACQGHFGYPLDDAYIHMAMAKNFALHGVWGITKYEFSSSTSSPLYTLLLAASYAISGVREITPLLLNAAASLALIAWCDFVFRDRGMEARIRIPLLCLIVFAIPLPSLALVGMEHVLHTLLTLIFVHLCGSRLANSARGSWIALWVFTSLLATVRYESIFLIGTAGLLFLLQGRWRVTAGLAAASVVPLAAYGWISLRHGWYLVPNSLLLKANVPGSESIGMFGSFLGTLRINFLQGIHVVLLMGAATLMLIAGRRGTAGSYSRTGLILFTAAAGMHLCCARVGWFYRYESYLIALGILVMAVAFFDDGFPRRGMLAASGYIFAGAFGLVIIYRSGHAFMRAPRAVSDIYDQQYQSGRFVREHLAGKTIVLDDIGAVSFLSEARVLDTVGLGSKESMEARIEKKFTTAWLDQWCHERGAVAAITYVFVAPPRWSKVATWTIPGNYISVADTVGIYSVTPEFRQDLEADVTAFRRELPSRVIVRETAGAQRPR